MEATAPTRMNLLAKKAQRLLAQQGRDLLEQKREALLREFMRNVDLAVRDGESLDRLAADAAYALAFAKAIDGPEAVRSASIAALDAVSVEVDAANVMGVSVPTVRRESLPPSPLERGYSLPATTARIDDVAERFEAELDLLIELAAVETRLRRLGDEIKATSRRVNALDNVFIPRLDEQMRRIAATLEEREREDVFRLKRVKKRLASAR